MSFLHIGFTGTQHGCTPEQFQALREALLALQRRGFTHLHHGDCIGADSEADSLANELGLIVARHPPENSTKRAFCNSALCFPPKPYLERNHDIVDVSGILVACPKGMSEERRSGTWATVRYAKRNQIPVLFVWPDGSSGSIAE